MSHGAADQSSAHKPRAFEELSNSRELAKSDEMPRLCCYTKPRACEAGEKSQRSHNTASASNTATATRRQRHGDGAGAPAPPRLSMAPPTACSILAARTTALTL